MPSRLHVHPFGNLPPKVNSLQILRIDAKAAEIVMANEVATRAHTPPQRLTAYEPDPEVRLAIGCELVVRAEDFEARHLLERNVLAAG